MPRSRSLLPRSETHKYRAFLGRRVEQTSLERAGESRKILIQHRRLTHFFQRKLDKTPRTGPWRLGTKTQRAHGCLSPCPPHGSNRTGVGGDVLRSEPPGPRICSGSWGPERVYAVGRFTEYPRGQGRGAHG